MLSVGDEVCLGVGYVIVICRPVPCVYVAVVVVFRSRNFGYSTNSPILSAGAMEKQVGV